MSHKDTHVIAEPEPEASTVEARYIEIDAGDGKPVTRLDTQETYQRSVTIERGAIDPEARTVELAFSSEAPVERWFGIEVLDHTPASVRLGRLRSGTHPLLVDHNTSDQVGVIESATIGDDRKGRAVVRFGQSLRAQEIFQDVQDGIRRLVSVGYRLHDREPRITKGKDGKPDRVRFMDWEPLEISIVPIPADTTVGVGRSQEGAAQEKNTSHTVRHEHSPTSDERSATSDQGTPQLNDQGGSRTMPEATTEPTNKGANVAVIDAEAERKAARKEEQHRVREILAIGDLHGCQDLARTAVQEGTDLDAFRKTVLETRYKDQVKPIPNPNPEIGMSQKELNSYSILRAVRAILDDRRDQAGFEFEVSEAARKQYRKTNLDGANSFTVPGWDQDPNWLRTQEKIVAGRSYFTIPYDVLKHNQQRDLVVGTGTAGGNTVATMLLAGSFIELLRNRQMVRAMGARVLGGLVGNIAIPSQTGGATAYWVAEGAAPTESEQTFGQLGMNPKTVGAYTDLARRLINQSSIDVENFVRIDLATVLALAIDLAAINGSGTSNQPKGILQTTGIGDVSHGTNGGAPTWPKVVAIWKEVFKDNAAFGSLGWLTNGDVIGKLLTVDKGTDTGKYVVESFPDANGFTTIAGGRCGVSNQVPNTLTKAAGSNLSALIYGNWADLVIGEWGGLDVLVDPYTGGAAGTVRIRVLQDVDVAVRHAASFAAGQDIVTT